MYPRFTFVFLICLSIYVNGKGQMDAPVLERTVTLTVQNERLDIVLKKISEQARFTFSYNPSIIETEKLVSYNFKKKTVREILDIIFSGTIEYKVRARYIILTKSKGTPKDTDDKILSGYVIDEATGERLKNVSVYDPVTLKSAVTDSYGYFEIKIDDAATAVNLSVNKQDYADTVVAVSSNFRRLLNIPIRIDKKKWVTVADSVGEKIKRYWNHLFIKEAKPNVENIRDTIYRKAQLSVIPFVGTNHLMSANVINDYSLNVFGGYARGVRKLEAAGIFNIDEQDVNGGQLAGVFNVVGGSVRAAQFAGIFNANYGATHGAQFAGVANIDWNSSSDFSAAGVINFTRRDSEGAHLAGTGNFTLGNQRGAHAAGVFNFATGNVESFQGAGLLNFTAGNLRGSQIAGVLNFAAKDVKGTQAAGVLNFAGKRVTGSQVAGVLNYATKVNGVQIGLFNIADSVKGVPIGFFSFALHGYHKIEFSADEVFYLNAAFRTGVNKFYNIFAVGAKPETFSNDQTFWTFGYGVGTAPKLTKWLSLNIDVTANHIMTERYIEALNLLNKANVGFDLAITPKLSVYFGGTLNAYLTEIGFDRYQPLFDSYQPKLIQDRNVNNNINMKMWYGAKIGIRFL